LITAERRNGFIELDFQSEPAEMIDPLPVEIEKALGVRPKAFGRNRLDYLAEVDDENTLRSIDPDLSLIKTFTARGVIVTSSASTNGYDFVSRFFAPGAGIDEDPVTGSAHCCLGPYWQRILGKDTMVGYQASSRGGTVHVAVRGDRVLLSGQAVTVLRGELAC
jgi:predicted PhzF superfamily epimerase YddE/YHI9